MILMRSRLSSARLRRQRIDRPAGRNGCGNLDRHRTVLGAVSPTVGQQTSAADEEMMKTHQAMVDKYAVAIARKDVAAAAADSDGRARSFSPFSGISTRIGPEAYTKRVKLRKERVIQQLCTHGSRRRMSSVMAALGHWHIYIHHQRQGRQAEQARGNWIDMLRREGNDWKVSFQAYARTPC